MLSDESRMVTARGDLKSTFAVGSAPGMPSLKAGHDSGPSDRGRVPSGADRMALATSTEPSRGQKFIVPKRPPQAGKIPPRRGDRDYPVYNRVIFGTGNPRQSGAHRDLFHAKLAIPYQRRIDIRFVPIFPNTWVWERDKVARSLAESRELHPQLHGLVRLPAAAQSSSSVPWGSSWLSKNHRPNFLCSAWSLASRARVIG
jgi:hypothetical protein